MYDYDILPFYIVAGHVPVDELLYLNEKLSVIGPYMRDNVIGIDFGSSRKNGRLGMVLLLPYFGCIILPVGSAC